MNKEDVAMKLINLIEEKLESMQWDTIRGGVVETGVFISDEPETRFLNGYLSQSVSNNFMVIGQYMDRFYTDSDKFHDNLDYFISFGDLEVEDNDIPVPINVSTILRKDLKSASFKIKLKDLYEKIAITVSGADNTEEFFNSFIK